MSLLWLSIFLFSIAWLPLIGIYSSTTIHYTTPYWFIASLLSFGIIINIFILRSIDIEKIDKKYYLFFAPLLLSIYVFPFPYNLASIVLTIGLITSLFNRLGKIFTAITNGLIFSGIILAAQTAIIPFFFLIFSHYHRADWLTPIIFILLKFVGIENSITQNEIFIRNLEKVYSFITSWDIMALYSLLNIFVAGLVGIILFTNRKGNLRKVKNIIILILTLFIYMIFRYVGIILAFVNIKKPDVFWRLDIMFLSLIPVIFLLIKFIKFNQINIISLPSFNWSRQYVMPVIFAIIFAFSIAGFFGFHDPGIRKQGKILIDEGHSDWEWTVKKFDTEWYGRQSTYNYYSLAEYIKYFYQVEQKTDSLTDELLKEYDILMIKTPTEPFSNSEIEAIKKFVENGGGLFMIGDHTNVFGITTNLNPIASEFGLKFCYDGQYDLSGELSVYRPPEVLPHPVVQRMPAFLFATGCTMEAPLTAENVIIGYGIKSIYLDYSQKNFFPKNAAREETIEFGLFLQAAGTKYGKGRILGFTDSTVWSNFYMFIPGKPELLLGCVEWLNRQNGSLRNLRITFLFLALLSLILFIYISIKLKSHSLISISLFSILLTLAMSIAFFEKLNGIFYPSPKPHKKYVQVNFDYEHSDFEMPVLHVTREAKRSFSTFYTWLQRLDYVPQLCYNFKQSLKNGNVVVIINPRKPFTKDEIESFLAHIKNGGKAMIIDDPGAKNMSTAGQLLDPIGISIKQLFENNTAICYRENEGDSLRFTTQNAGEVVGGKPLVFADLSPKELTSPRLRYPSIDRSFPHLPGKDFPDQVDQRRQRSPMKKLKEFSADSIKKASKPIMKKIPVFATKNIGKGIVGVLACADVFTTAQMGYSGVIPNKNMRNIYEFEYWIFRDLFQL